VKIVKVLNNNVVVSQNAAGKEVIVMGKGLAFGKRSGERINESLVDKVFSLNGSKEISRFQELLETISEECMELAEECIDFAKVKLGKKMQNAIYISLTDHINTMLERAKLGAYLKNTLLWDIKRVHREEFLIGRESVLKVNAKMGTNFDDNEAASIALHFVNAQTELGFGTTTKITKVMSEILNIIKYHFRIDYDEDSLSYYRLIVHLRHFAQRLFSKTTFSDADDSELLEHIKGKYPMAYECSQLIKEFIAKQYEYVLEQEECLYLTIHISKVVKESKKV